MDADEYHDAPSGTTAGHTTSLNAATSRLLCDDAPVMAGVAAERVRSERPDGRNGHDVTAPETWAVLDWPTNGSTGVVAARPSGTSPSASSPREVYRPRWQRWLKRAVDLVVAPVVLVAVSPLVAASAVAIRLETPGPVLFRQRRVGAGGRPFCVFKLRTMHHGNDDGGHRDYVAALLEGRAERRGGLFKLVDDDRITRVGKVLRSWSLDEIPQLVNVLRGEMTLVGPRPALPNEIELYDERQRARLAGTPGITGLWQVSGRSELGYAEMIDLDLEYLENWSILRDLRILARTPAVVLSRRGVA